MRLTRSLLALSTLAALVLAAPATAEARKPTRVSHMRPPMRQDVSVSVVDAMGRSLPMVRHRGSMFVAGAQGQRYAVRIQNNTAQRVEVVVAVDGRDAVSGRMANFRTDRGYVVDGFGSVEIDGFRTSMQNVAAFRFSNVANSYTARRGTPQNAGVIGVAVFHERRRQPIAQGPMRKNRSRSGAADRDAAAPKDGRAEASAPRSASRSRPSGGMMGDFAPAPSRELGTEFGEQMRSEVVEVAFERQNSMRPDFMTTVMYDTPRGLAARGVPIEMAMGRMDDRPRPVAVDDRFAPPPPRGRMNRR